MTSWVYDENMLKFFYFITTLIYLLSRFNVDIVTVGRKITEI